MANSVYEILLKIDGDQKVQQTLNEIGTGLGLTGAALTAFAAGAGKMTADFETALANISTVSTEATGTTEEFEKALFDLQAQMEGAIDVQTAAVASYDMLSAGISDQGAILKALELGQKAAIGGQSDLNSVVTAAISGVNAYGEQLGVGTDQAAQFEKVINLIMQTQLDGVITADQYAQSFGQITSLAASSGTSLEGLNAMIAVTTVKGIPASIAINNLKAAMANVSVPTKQATDEAERLGIQFDAAALKSKGLDGVLKDVAASGKANASTISQLFGSVEAQSGVSAILGDMELLNTMIERQANGMGALDKVYAATSETVNQKVTRSINLLKASLIQVGEGALVAIAPLLEMFAKLASQLAAMPGWAKALVGGFTVLTGVSLTLAGAGALLITTASGTVAAYGTLTAQVLAHVAAMRAAAIAQSNTAIVMNNSALASFAFSKAIGVLNASMLSLGKTLVAMLPMMAKLALAYAAFKSLMLVKETFDATNAAAKPLQESISTLDEKLLKINETAKGSSLTGIVPDEATQNMDALKESIGGVQTKLDSLRSSLGLMTTLELATRKGSVAFQELLTRVNDVKIEAGELAGDLEDGLDVDPSRVKAALESIQVAIEALQIQKLTRPEEIAARDKQIAQLEAYKARIEGVTQESERATVATEESSTVTEENTDKVDEAAQAYEDYASKIRSAISAVDAQKDVDLGNLTGSEASKISEGLAIEERATQEKIALLEDLAAQSQTTAEERRDIEIQIQREMMEITKKRIEATKALEEEYNDFQRAKLSQRKAELEASAIATGATIADTFGQRRALIEEEFQLESEILRRQIAQAAEGSAEKAKAESDLAKLRVESLEEQKALGDELKAYQDQQRAEMLEKEKAALDEKLANIDNYYGQAIEQATYAQQYLEDSSSFLGLFEQHADDMISILGQVNSLLESDNTTLAQRAELIGLASELTGQTFRTNESMSAMEQASLALQSQMAQFELEKLNLKIEQLKIDREALAVAQELKNLEIENRRANIQAELEGNSELTAAQRTAKTRELQSLDREQTFNNRSTEVGMRGIDNQIEMTAMERRLAEIMSRNIGPNTAGDLRQRANDAISGNDRGLERQAISEANRAYQSGIITREDLDEILENSKEAQAARQEEARKAQEERQRDRESNDRVTSRTQGSLAEVASSSRATSDRVGESAAVSSQGFSELTRINNQMLEVQRLISGKLDTLNQQVRALPGSIVAAIPRPAAIPSRR